MFKKSYLRQALRNRGREGGLKFAKVKLMLNSIFHQLKMILKK